MTETFERTRVALVGLETSHPDSFAPLINDLGYAVSAVLDLPGTGPRGRGEEFARRHGIPDVLQGWDELADACDVAILLGCDWDARFAQVARLLESGLGVIVDKPMAGQMGQLRALDRLAADGARIAGGSSLRSAPEFAAWKAAHEGASLVLAGCAGQPFYYGVHATSSVAALLGPGIEACRAERSASGLRGTARHRDGALAVVDVRPPHPGHAFYATVVTDGGVTHLVPDVGRLYRGFLTASLAAVSGPCGQSVVGLTEPEQVVLAIEWSRQHGSGWVTLDSVPDDFAPWSGREFLRAYTQG